MLSHVLKDFFIKIGFFSNFLSKFGNILLESSTLAKFGDSSPKNETVMGLSHELLLIDPAPYSSMKLQFVPNRAPSHIGTLLPKT